MRIAARLELSNLKLEGARRNALPEQLEAVQFGLDQAALVIFAPFLPDVAAKPRHRALRFVAGVDAKKEPMSISFVQAAWIPRLNKKVLHCLAG